MLGIGNATNSWLTIAVKYIEICCRTEVKCKDIRLEITNLRDKVYWIEWGLMYKVKSREEPLTDKHFEIKT